MKQGAKDQEPTAPTRSHHGCCADKACTEATCMELPPGKKCGDCVHAYRCCLMFGHGNMDTYCDWFPRRFHEKTPNAALRPRAEGESSLEGTVMQQETK